MNKKTKSVIHPPHCTLIEGIDLLNTLSVLIAPGVEGIGLSFSMVTFSQRRIAQ